MPHIRAIFSKINMSNNYVFYILFNDNNTARDKLQSYYKHLLKHYPKNKIPIQEEKENIVIYISEKNTIEDLICGATYDIIYTINIDDYVKNKKYINFYKDAIKIIDPLN